MKKMMILGLLLGVMGYTYSQTITVKDNDTGEPLELVTLISHDPKAFVTTNPKGQADISDFKGAEHIEIRSLGYKTLVMSYTDIKSQAFTVELDHSPLNMDAVVVSATRWQQSLNNVPSKIATISPKEIALQNPQTAADLLGVSGEVFIQKSQQGVGSPMIRGFATNRLLYTIDGVRMNTAIFRGGNIQNVISLDPYAIENTEVLFGPGSVIYGSDAIGGVMSFQTLTPQFSLEDEPMISGKAATRYSSANNEKTAHFHVNAGWKKWAMVTSISTNNYGNLKMGTHGPDAYLKPYYIERIDSTDVVVRNKNPEIQRPSGYSQINMMQKLRYKPNEAWDLKYGFHYSETSSYGRFDRHLRFRDSHPRYAQWDYGPQKWLMNKLTATHENSHTLYNKMTIRLAQQYFEESRIDRSLNDPEQRNRIEKIDAYSVNLDFNKSLSQRNELIYGFEWVQNDVNSTAFIRNINTNAEMDAPTRYPQSTWSSYAAFVTDHYEISDKWMLQAGLRYNQFNIDAKFDTTFYGFPFTKANLNNGALTGNLGFTYRPDDSWVIKASASTGFRSPNVDDVGKVFDSEPGSVVVPNPDLQAEYAYSADLGIAKVINEKVKIDFTGFYTNLQDAMVRRDYVLNGRDSILYDGVMSQVQAIQNAAVANVYGFQAGIEIKLPKGFEFSSDFNYQQGEEELDDGTTSPSRHAAPWFGVSRLSYRTDGINLQFYTEYSGEVEFEDLAVSEQGKPELYAPDGNGNHYAPGWYTLNFKAMYHLTESLRIVAGLENITDQRYRTYSSGISAPGRNFMISLRASF